MAMSERKDFHAHYGAIEAIKGISFEVNQDEVIAWLAQMAQARQPRFIR